MTTNRKPLSPANALYRAAALCSKSEQAEADIRLKLKTWGISANDADNIVTRLIQEKYLDEERFARAFCRDKFRFAGWGRIKIAFALKQKSITPAIVSTVTAEIDETEYSETLKHALASKMRSVAHKDPMQAKASLYRFAASRGFEPNLIFPLIDNLLNNEED